MSIRPTDFYKNFIESITQKLMHKFSWNFIFSYILMMFFISFTEIRWNYIIHKKLTVFMDLHVIYWTQFDSFWKMSVWVRQTLCGKCNLKTNAPNFTKFYIQFLADLNWCLSTFGGNWCCCYTFPRILQILASTEWNHTKFYT